MIFSSYMSRVRPERETCPLCGSSGNCRIHAYYGRSIIDYSSGRRTVSDLCILRVRCDSCGHTHAILPDLIIPYSRYSLLFILQVLAEYFTRRCSVDALCEKFNLSREQIYQWLKLFRSHKQEWLGVLKDAEISEQTFLHQLYQSSYSSFSEQFIRRTAFSFLQSHKNPCVSEAETAGFAQQVFLPDYDIW